MRTRLLLAVVLIFMASMLFPVAALAASPGVFADRSLWANADGQVAWAKDIIDDAIRFELFTGYPRGTVTFDLGEIYGEMYPETRGVTIRATITPEFRPLATITRAEFATILARATGFEDSYVDGDMPPFRDMAPDSWYLRYVAPLFRKNVVRLVDRPGDRFYPGEPITRVEIAAWVARAADAYGINVGPAPVAFEDAGAIGSMWRQDVGKAVALGIVNGYPDGTFRPDGHATRAEAAKMVMMLLQHFTNDLPTPEELIAAYDAISDAVSIWQRDNPQWRFAVSEWQTLLAKWFMPGALTWWYVPEGEPCAPVRGTVHRALCGNIDDSLVMGTASARLGPFAHYGVGRALLVEAAEVTDRTAKVRFVVLGQPIYADGNRSTGQGKDAITVYLRKDGGRWKRSASADYVAGEGGIFDPDLPARVDGKTLEDVP